MKINDLLFEAMSVNQAKDIFERFGVTDPLKYTPEQLKKLYIALVKKNHPDVGGNVESMKDINAAYDILSKEPQQSDNDYKPTYSNSGKSRYKYNWEDDDYDLDGEDDEPDPLQSKNTQENPTYENVKVGDKFHSDARHGNKQYTSDYISTVVGIKPISKRFGKPDRVVIVNIVSGNYTVDTNKHIWVSQLRNGLV